MACATAKLTPHTNNACDVGRCHTNISFPTLNALSTNPLSPLRSMYTMRAATSAGPSDLLPTSAASYVGIRQKKKNGNRKQSENRYT